MGSQASFKRSVPVLAGKRGSLLDEHQGAPGDSKAAAVRPSGWTSTLSTRVDQSVAAHASMLALRRAIARSSAGAAVPVRSITSMCSVTSYQFIEIGIGALP